MNEGESGVLCGGFRRDCGRVPIQRHSIEYLTCRPYHVLHSSQNIPSTCANASAKQIIVISVPDPLRLLLLDAPRLDAIQ